MIRDPFLAVLSFTVLLITATFTLVLLGRRLSVVGATLLAFFVRLAIGVTDYSYNGLSLDAGRYHTAALDLVAYWGGGPEPTLSLGKEGWPHILAGLYELFGPVPELGLLLNAFLSALTVLLVADICRRYTWNRSITPAAYLVALWPVSVMWSGLLLREASISFLLALSLWGVTLVRTRQWLLGWLTMALAGLAMVPMRGGMAMLLLVGIPALLAVEAVLSRRVGVWTRIVTVASAVAAFVYVLPRLNARFESLQLFDENHLSRVSRANNGGSTSFDTAGIDTSALQDNRAVEFAQTLLGPFPWQIKGPSLLSAAADAVLWLGITALIVVAFLYLKDRWAILYSVAPAVAVLYYLSSSASNFGIIMRMRGSVLVLIAPVAGWAIAYLWGKYQGSRSKRAEEFIPRPLPYMEIAESAQPVARS